MCSWMINILNLSGCRILEPSVQFPAKEWSQRERKQRVERGGGEAETDK